MRVQIDESVYASTLRADDVRRLDRAAGGGVQTLFRDEQAVLRAVFSADGKERRALRIAQRVLEGDGGIVTGDLVILIIDNISDGVLNAEACDQQRRAAADADRHHDHALFIAQDVPDRDLVQKRDPVPDKGEALQ